MEIYELVIEMKLLERRLTLYEEKYASSARISTRRLCQASWHVTMSTTRLVPILAGGKGSMKHGYDAKQPTLSKCNSVTSLKRYVSNQPIKNG